MDKLFLAACTSDLIEAVEHCLAHGRTVNDRNEIGMTPLMLAASVGSISVSLFLIDQGADFLAQNNANETAADVAKNNKHFKLGELLSKLCDESKVDVSRPAPIVDDGEGPPKKASGRPPGGTGRRPGRPSKNPGNNDADFGDSGDGEHKVEVVPDFKPVKSGKRGKGDAKDLISRGPVTPEEYEARRNRLKSLIKLGKDRGYLTYGEINDYLPDDLVDAEAIDGIISTFSDMGIAVCDQAPDAEMLLLGENAPAATSDDDVEDEAALTTVASDFGRTTDPVRMFMREMGTVERLTREGEIEVSKRIEEGLKAMMMAISSCPSLINDILNHAQRIRNGQERIDEVVDGLTDLDECVDYGTIIVPERTDEDGPAGGKSDQQLAELLVQSLAKFKTVETELMKMRLAYEKDGYLSAAYVNAQKAIQNELMEIRLNVEIVEQLAGTLGAQVAEILKIERQIMRLCVDRAGMPRNYFLKALPSNVTNLEWIPNEVAGRSDYAPVLAQHSNTVQNLQKELINLQTTLEIPIKELKASYRTIALKASKVHQAKREMLESNSDLVISVASKYTNLGIGFLDLISEGNNGLMRAVEKFNYRQGYKFSTCANWWIHQAIKLLLADQKYKNNSPDNINKTISDDPFFNSRDFNEKFTDSNALDSVFNKSMRDAVHEVLNSLTTIEEKILRMRFGIDMDSGHSIEEISEHLSISPEEILKIETHAFRKLRHPSRADILNELFDRR
ncbi:RNA polymerase sigma factor RpoD [Burkholderiaceae bacterium]